MQTNHKILFIIGGCFLIAASLYAEVAVSISPMRVEHSVQPGAALTDSIAITNTGTDAVRMQVLIKDWQVLQDGSPYFLNEGSHAYSCSSWIQANPTDFRLAPNQTRTIRYSLQVPQNAEEKGYWSAITFEFLPEVKPGEAKRVLFKGQIVTTVYAVVGKPEVRGEITGLRAEMKDKKLHFVLGLKNSGKVHFRIKGKLSIKNATGKEVINMELPDTPSLPQSLRDVLITVEKELEKGKYSALAIVDIGAKEIYGAEAQFTIE